MATRTKVGVRLGEPSARAMILQGAAMVFAQHGVRAPTVEDLLEASGVSRRTFYKHYASKEDVVAALYRWGTDRLVDACKRAVSEERDPMRRIDLFIDAHLRTAREFGRLVFVLGGDAQRLESPLHKRRMEVHEALIALFQPSAGGRRRSVDPLLHRGLILALEGVTRVVLEEGDEGRNVTDESIERARRVMRRIATAALAGAGEGVAPLPAKPRP